MPEVPFYDLRAAVRGNRAHLHEVLDATIDGGYFIGGAAVSRFEREFAAYLGVSECVGVGNGLDGLRIAMEVLGIGPGDEVIVPGFTFYATWLAVMQTGATPVPVDVDLTTAGMDAASVEAAISDRTKAILVVHLYGIPADLATLRRIADKAEISLIEDAAQSHGAKSGGLMTGSVGEIASYSFYPTKNLGALGDGGAIVTNSAELAAAARSRRSYGQGASKYDHVDTGWNSRLDTLQAAFLSEGLTGLDDRNQRRREIATAYLEALGDVRGAVVGSGNLSESVWHQFVVRAGDRDGARDYLSQSGVGTDIHYPYDFGTLAPTQKYGPTRPLPNSRALAREVLSLPIGPMLTDAEVSQVAEALAQFPRELLAAL